MLGTVVMRGADVLAQLDAGAARIAFIADTLGLSVEPRAVLREALDEHRGEIADASTT